MNMNQAMHAVQREQQYGQISNLMQVLYGDKFQKTYGGMNVENIMNGMRFVLGDLSDEQLIIGLERMKSEKWCPTLPEFREWCLDDPEWWSAELAWAKAMLYLTSKTTQITTLTELVLREIKGILDIEGQRAAKSSFIAIYNDYLEKAKKRGKKQEYFVLPKLIVMEEFNPDSAITMPDEIRQKLIKVLDKQKCNHFQSYIDDLKNINQIYANKNGFDTSKLLDLQCVKKLDMMRENHELRAVLIQYDDFGLLYGKK